MNTQPSSETIYALATPSGKSGVAVLRVSGERVPDVIKVFGGKAVPPARKAILTTLISPHDAHAPIDQALMLYFAAPHSFTGEDIVEYHLHGSMAVVKAVMGALDEMPDVRIAQAGEFSRRAFENGKMDLTQIEGVADLIDAETAAQAAQALRQMRGEQGRIYAEMRDAIILHVAHLEAYLDFPDEDIPDDVLSGLRDGIKAIECSISMLINDNNVGEMIRDGFSIAIIGPPNAGKSSLINALAKRDVAIVSEQEGTTRDVIEVHCDMGGYKVILSDTAGLHDARDVVEKEGIKRARLRAEEADMVIAMCDIAEPEKLDANILKLLKENSRIFLNKSDKADWNAPESWRSYDPIKISLHSDHDITAIEQALSDAVKMHMQKSESSLVTRARHREALQAALLQLQSSHSITQEELLCETLRRAAQKIGEITGFITVDEVLDRIFSSFCIGK